MKQPDAWILEERDSNGAIVWQSIMFVRPTELSWLRDLPTKKHNITLTPLYKDESKAEVHNGIKSFKDATKRLIEANGGL
jgi:hypothetical protein